MKPEFPLRMIFDDGECLVVDSPEELLSVVDSIEAPGEGVWVRDAMDRTVRIRMRGGIVEELRV